MMDMLKSLLVVIGYALVIYLGFTWGGSATAVGAPVSQCSTLATQDARSRCIIRSVFHPHGSAAVRVAWCESRLDPQARNGQYRGVFQMGAAERARFGHGRSVLAQARAAKRYYNLAGWVPWACRGGV